MSRAIFPTFLALVLAATPFAAAEEKAVEGNSLLRALDREFVQVFEKLAPSVVVIETMKQANDEDEDDARAFDFLFREGEEPQAKPREKRFSLPQQLRSEGSGFIIRGDGYILTNDHVIEDAERIDVRLKDGRTFKAKLVGADDKTDIAVIKIEAKDLPAATLGDSDSLKVGQLVCAIGAPFNQDYSFTCGWVSGKGRSNLLAPTSRTILYEDYIQTDAFINPGNSGGPLFDVDGKIVGMNTLINGIGRGLAFAIPSNMLQEISGQLIANGRVQRSWLGVRIETLGENPALAENLTGVEHGVVVDTVEASTPAYHSDLRPADVITEVDGVKLLSARDLQKEVTKKKVGQTLQLTVWRSGNYLKIPVTTAELPDDLSRFASKVDSKALGLRLTNGEKAGAVVLEVAPDGSAAKADIHPNDLITDIASKPVANADDAMAMLSGISPENRKKGVLLNLERDGKRTMTILKLTE